MAYQDLLYEAQAKRISDLMQQLSKRNAEFERLKAKERAADFYLKLQKYILENDLLMEEWTRFMAFLMLTYPDIEDMTK